MKLKNGSALLSDRAELTELPKRASWGARFLRADRLVRNLAVVGALLLTVVAVKNAGAPQAQSVFSALEESAGLQWDESLGKLSFVNALLPEELQAVWSETEALTVFAPIVGQTVHAWSQQEPYVEFQSTLTDVRAVADGEVMSIAHGLDEERIVRIRHDDDTESLYGNLETCYCEVGDIVYAGDVFAKLLSDKPLAFELRKDGRSVNPEGMLKEWQD